MKLAQFELALILCALHTERATITDEWQREQITKVIEKIGAALAATATPTKEA